MNARYRPYNPGEGYFTLIDPEDIKNHNPLLKAIDSFVEDHISVEPFSQSARNELEGAPAVHLRMMLKVIFYSYAKGIYSSREMEDRMRWDPNYIYLNANQRVDHSTLCDFILKYGDEIKAVFSRLVYVMAKQTNAVIVGGGVSKFGVREAQIFDLFQEAAKACQPISLRRIQRRFLQRCALN